MLADSSARNGRQARVLGATLGLMVGTATTVPHLVHDYQKAHVLEQLGLDARVSDVRRVTADDFNADGCGPDYRLEFTDGTVAYFFHRGYTAYIRRPHAPPPTQRGPPPAYLASHSVLEDAVDQR